MQPRQWARWLPWAEYSYNTATHLSTKMTPFKVVYGREPTPLVSIGKGQTPVNNVEEMLQERDAMLAELHMNLMRAQLIMKTVADTRRRDECFAIGDFVYLKLQAYRQRSLARRPFEKLAAKFYGPFEVLQQIGKVAYKLKLPPESKIHPVFHVSQLRRAMGTITAYPTIPNQINSDMELKVTPEHLLDIRLMNSGGQRRR